MLENCISADLSPLKHVQFEFGDRVVQKIVCVKILEAWILFNIKGCNVSSKYYTFCALENFENFTSITLKNYQI